MVHLTFIRYADLSPTGSILFKDAEQLYLLTQIVVEQFGKPQLVYCAEDDNGLWAAKIVNLACKAGSIHISPALNTAAVPRDAKAFIDFIESEARRNSNTHILLICSFQTFKILLHQTALFGTSYTLCSENWHNILNNYAKMWSPFQPDDDSREQLQSADEKLPKRICSTGESLLIKETIKICSAI